MPGVQPFGVCAATGALLVLASGLHPQVQARRNLRECECAHRPAPVDHAAPIDCQVYGPYEEDLANRLFCSFFVRRTSGGHEYGGDILDPYLWSDTRSLLSEAFLRYVAGLIRQFLQSDDQRAFRTPVERAFFQRDMIAVDHWLSSVGSPDRRKAAILQPLLTELISRVAMSVGEINAIPTNEPWARAAMTGQPTQGRASRRIGLPVEPPPDNWVCIGEADGGPLPITHLDYYGARSLFVVLMRAGRSVEDSLAYLRTFNPSLLGIPNGRHLDLSAGPVSAVQDMDSSFALIRSMVLVDTAGGATPTHLIESVQTHTLSSRGMQFADFELSRRRLFQGIEGGLVELGPGDLRQSTFILHAVDPFQSTETAEGTPEQSGEPAIAMCRSCHDDSVARGVLSYSRPRFAARSREFPIFVASTADRELDNAMRWLQARRERPGAEVHR